MCELELEEEKGRFAVNFGSLGVAPTGLPSFAKMDCEPDPPFFMNFFCIEFPPPTILATGG